MRKMIVWAKIFHHTCLVFNSGNHSRVDKKSVHMFYDAYNINHQRIMYEDQLINIDIWEIKLGYITTQ